MERILIENGRIIDPANDIDRIGSVYITNGKIASVIYKPIGFVPDRMIDARNLIVCPGFIDTSARLREPGQTRKATIASETRAAAAGGVTTLCQHPDTVPVADSSAVVEQIKDLARKAGYHQIEPIAALTQQLEGAELSAMLTLKQAGCIAVSNANAPIKNLLVLRRAMEYAASHDLLFIYRPADHALSNRGCINEGRISTRYGLPSVPEVSETIALMQCLELVKLTGCRVHFGQISCTRSVTLIAQAKAAGLNVSADTAMHQLHLTEDNIVPFDSLYHVQPPLRTLVDKDALREGVINGVIDCICSDHQPHDLDAKLGAFPETEPGISSLETLLPLMIRLVEEGVLTLAQGIATLTCKPAHILGLTRGTLSIESPADICVFDQVQTWSVNHDNWYSQGTNTPFWGEALKGRVMHTLQNGKLIHSL